MYYLYSPDCKLIAVELKDYDQYIEFFTNILIPQGYGARYCFANYNKKTSETDVYLRLVYENEKESIS